MGILENSIGAMFGRGSGDNDGPSFGGAAYAPLATALIGLLATKAMMGGFGNLGGLFGGGQSQPAPQQGQAPQGEPQGGGGLLGGLGGLMHSFEQNGMGQVAQSWIGSGQNQTVAPPAGAAGHRSRHHPRTRAADRPLRAGGGAAAVAGAARHRQPPDPARPHAEPRRSLKLPERHEPAARALILGRFAGARIRGPWVHCQERRATVAPDRLKASG